MSNIEVNGKSLGRLAFEAYCEAVGGLTFDGKPIPDWDNLHGDRAKVQAGWEAAADKVATVVRFADQVDKSLEGPFTPGRWRPLGSVVQDRPLPLADGGDTMMVRTETRLSARPLEPADEATVERSHGVTVDVAPDEDAP